MKSSISITDENCEESISLTLRTRNSNKPSRMLVRNWKHQWLPPCLARQARTVSMWWQVVNPTKLKTKLACILEASESTRLRMGELLPNHHEDHIAGNWCQFTATLQFGTQIHSYASSCENSSSKSSSGKEWVKLDKKIPAWDITKIRNNSEVIDEARTKGVKVHFASLMDICHLKMLNWRQRTKNTKVELYYEVIW